MLTNKEIEAEGQLIASNLSKLDSPDEMVRGAAQRAITHAAGRLLGQLLVDVHRIADGLAALVDET